jgi:LmbE family N-acetylglucosaminyl deacetylase
MWIPEAQVVRPRRHLVLSPHYDDAALSCGGLLALLAASGRQPRVAVIFGGEPDPKAPLTDFARFQHERWGLPPGEVIAARRREEANAMRILGAKTELLPFADAIYRGEAYTTETSLFAPPVAFEAALPEQIIQALDLPAIPDPEIRVYAPLALGGHVDHRLARVAGLLLAEAGWPVWFYEDLPYALQTPEVVPEHDGDAWEPRLIDISGYWPEKMAAVLAYPSQNSVIFRHVAPQGDAAGIERAMAAYARALGDGERKAERYWEPIPE